MAAKLTGFGYGTRRDRPDPRDHIYAPPTGLQRKAPKKVDLRPLMPPVYDQRHLNSCSANAIAAALWFEERHRHDNPRHPSPSRLFIYFNERAIENVLAHNGPVSLRSGYKTVARDGVCSERMWPYRVRDFREAPPPHCREAATQHRAVRYMRLRPRLTHLRACLAEHRPFTFGFAVYQTFKSQLVKRTGVVPRPSKTDKRLGGHAMVAVGYLDDSRHIIARNSWGTSWGDGGYCYVPYDYLLDPNLAWDFWTVTKAT
jgi:C1A family cysteine protease